ncbi:hypothetical protein M413DRAFT_438088 [Hebeloma cylindrosporum]|uniref:Uncharacterized protein n=1 Tax=Hebeloma cylindrosporum TaxID=76867 RepID=A0A0C2YGT9_HEBCY|nr:hypothetical protein M413DRAFT_438088 [Hebeloma cylindrosporum h7]
MQPRSIFYGLLKWTQLLAPSCPCEFICRSPIAGASENSALLHSPVYCLVPSALFATDTAPFTVY